MGRLRALTKARAGGSGWGTFACVLSFATAACDEPAPAIPPPSRVDSVQERAPKAAPLTEFCDVLHEPGRGATLRMPPFEGTPRADGARWLNVWATWCKPCVEEIPRIVSFCDERARKGAPLAFELLSVDVDAATVETFQKEHRGIPAGLRLTDASALHPWLSEIGLDAGAGLPIHVFVEAAGQVRCVRAGAVSETDFASVALLFP